MSEDSDFYEGLVAGGYESFLGGLNIASDVDTLDDSSSDVNSEVGSGVDLNEVTHAAKLTHMDKSSKNLHKKADVKTKDNSAEDSDADSEVNIEDIIEYEDVDKSSDKDEDNPTDKDEDKDTDHVEVTLSPAVMDPDMADEDSSSDEKQCNHNEQGDSSSDESSDECSSESDVDDVDNIDDSNKAGDIDDSNKSTKKHKTKVHGAGQKSKPKSKPKSKSKKIKTHKNKSKSKSKEKSIPSSPKEPIEPRTDNLLVEEANLLNKSDSSINDKSSTSVKVEMYNREPDNREPALVLSEDFGVSSDIDVDVNTEDVEDADLIEETFGYSSDLEEDIPKQGAAGDFPRRRVEENTGDPMDKDDIDESPFIVESQDESPFIVEPQDDALPDNSLPDNATNLDTVNLDTVNLDTANLDLKKEPTTAKVSVAKSEKPVANLYNADLDSSILGGFGEALRGYLPKHSP